MALDKLKKIDIMFIDINKIINKIDLEDKMITINYDQSKLRQQELQIQAEKERLIVDMLRREDNQKSLLGKVISWIVSI